MIFACKKLLGWHSESRIIMRFVILVPVSLSIWHTQKPSRRKTGKSLCDGLLSQCEYTTGVPVGRVAKTVTQKIGLKLRDGMKVRRFPAQIRLREPFGVARAACFERMAGVFAIRAAPPNTTAT